MELELIVDRVIVLVPVLVPVSLVTSQYSCPVEQILVSSPHICHYSPAHSKIKDYIPHWSKARLRLGMTILFLVFFISKTSSPARISL